MRSFINSKTFHFFAGSILILNILFSSSCKKDHPNEGKTTPTNGGTGGNNKPSSTKDILSFSLLKADNTSFYPGDETVSIVGDSIKIIVPGTAILNSLLAQVQINGVKVSPASSIKQDFTNSVVYTVTAEDSTKKTYVVAVKQDKLKNLVYVGSSDKNFYALDSRNGNAIWNYTANGGFNYSNPILDNGTIYAGNADANMYALNAAYGTVKWKFAAAGSILSAPALANGIIYFGSDDHNIYAVDAANGNLKWKFTSGGNVDSSPVISNGIVFIGSTDGNLYALDATSGSIKWQYAMSAIVEASPVVSNSVVFIGERNGYLNAIDIASGILKWKFSTNGISLEQSRPTVSNGVVYFASWYNTNDFTKAGSVYAINETDGSLKWQALDNTGFSTGPTVADGNVFISGDDGNLYALNASNGNVLWKNQVLPNGAMATVNSGTVFIAGGGSNYIYALNETDGSIKWRSPLANGLDNSRPVVIDANGNQ
jgi:eukaryotic-like serine/threonine-protein kinase